MSNQPQAFEQLIEKALTTDGGLEKMEKLIALQQEAIARNARVAFFEAKAKMQAALPVIKKQKRNQHNNSMFASLDDVALQIQPVLEQYGFSYAWEQQHNHETGMIRVTCVLTHAQGHQERNHIDALPDMAGAQGKANKTQVQGTASTITYLRRYTLTGVVGVATADADIDGRIEGVTERQQQKALTSSATINQMLPNLTAARVSDLLISSTNLEELNTAGKLIAGLPTSEQEELKTTYFEIREQFTAEAKQ